MKLIIEVETPANEKGIYSYSIDFNTNDLNDVIYGAMNMDTVLDFEFNLKYMLKTNYPNYKNIEIKYL